MASTPLHLPQNSGKALIISDLHHDFWLDDKRDPLEISGIDLQDFDVVIVAGDLTNKPKVRWKPALTWLSQHIAADRVCIFPGNHDYYNHFIDDDDRLKQIATDMGANFVQDREVFVGDTRFLCSTLWTDLGLAESPTHASVSSRKMNDYQYIRHRAAGFRRIDTSFVQLAHRMHRKFLAARLATPHDGETYVVTHHAPVKEATGEGELDCFYASDMEDFILTHKPDRWYYGHTHDALAHTCGETIIQNISLGYPSELSDDAVIERVQKSIVQLPPVIERTPSV